MYLSDNEAQRLAGLLRARLESLPQVEDHRDHSPSNCAAGGCPPGSRDGRAMGQRNALISAIRYYGRNGGRDTAKSPFGYAATERLLGYAPGPGRDR